jgi:uncharacterized protein YndB with AHSA1/START domain
MSTNTSSFLNAEVSHIFKAPAEKVFDAWLNPEMTANWMFGPAVRDEEVVMIEIDPQVGGSFSFLVKRDTLVVDHIGTYLKLEKPSHLEFNWGVKGMKDSSRVIVKISPNDSGCKLTLVHELDPTWGAYLEKCEEGWSLMLTTLDKLLKT